MAIVRYKIEGTNPLSAQHRDKYARKNKVFYYQRKLAKPCLSLSSQNS